MDTNNSDWKKDSRLNNISKEKLDILTNIISGANGLSNNEIIPFFLKQTTEASSNGIYFTDAETELIIDVLKAGMTPEQRKRIEIVKRMSIMLNKKK